MISYKLIHKGFNKRHRDVKGMLDIQKNTRINISSHSPQNEVVRQTAKGDLNQLLLVGLIQESRERKKLFFTIASQFAVGQSLNK